jgi:glycine/D-amino acid oxidase-like deaminating enzyme
MRIPHAFERDRSVMGSIPMHSGVLADTFTTEPYWTEGLPPFRTSATSAQHVDVAVIGGGFAGLSCALTLAGAGCAVTVFEAGTIGAGAAARAAGSLSHVPKAKLPELTTLYGRATALAFYQEARQAREYVEALIRNHQIVCNLHSCDRFIAAHSGRAYQRQCASLDSLQAAWGDVELVPRGEQRRLIGSDAFFGGIKLANSATLQPALFQRGLAGAALSAGATILQGRRVIDVQRNGTDFELVTAAGTYRADHVIVATNADTDIGPARFRSLARRVMVVPAFALATEELPTEQVSRVLPIAGPVSDTYKIIHYIAPSHDGRRLIVSARAGRTEGSLRNKAARMLAYFADRFPDLAGAKVSHCWQGRFTVSADWVPHIGVDDGIHFVIGCCGTGISTSTYLGHKIAAKILRRADAGTVFDRPLPALPFLGAGELLLPIAVRAYALSDRLFR